MSKRDVTAEEALKFWYDLAKHENPPGMVESMLGAVARNWTKMVMTDKGIAFNLTPEGEAANRKTLATLEGRQILANLRRNEMEKL